MSKTELTWTCNSCKTNFSYTHDNIIIFNETNFHYYQTYSRNVKCPSCGQINKLSVDKKFRSEYDRDMWKREHISC